MIEVLVSDFLQGLALADFVMPIRWVADQAQTVTGLHGDHASWRDVFLCFDVLLMFIPLVRLMLRFIDSRGNPTHTGIENVIPVVPALLLSYLPHLQTNGRGALVQRSRHCQHHEISIEDSNCAAHKTVDIKHY